MIVIDLHSGVPGSEKSLLATYRAVDVLLERTNVVPNFPMGMSYFRKYKRGKFFYIPTGKIIIKFLLVFAKWNHVHEGRKAEKVQTAIIIGEVEIRFNSRTFSSSDRIEWIFFFADHRHPNYGFWLAVRSDRMIDRQIRDLVQTELKCRVITGSEIEGKLMSFLFGGPFYIALCDHAGRTKFLLSQFYRLYKRKAGVYDTMHMSDGVTTAGKLEGGKKGAVSVKG